MTIATAPSGQKALGNEDRALAYVAWRLACLAVWSAYREWADAPRPEASLAHAAYRAALDREHAAADAYARLVRNASRAVAGRADSRPASRSRR